MMPSDANRYLAASSFEDNVDVFYSLICGALIFFMQCGFAMLCAGSVRQKNVKNIMLKNILDACGGAIGFFTIGYALAYGSRGSFLPRSGEKYFLHSYTAGTDYIDWFFQFTFAATAATIVAGTVAERCKMSAYLCYSFMLTAFVYPVIVHAVWNTEGVLKAGGKTDNAGNDLAAGDNLMDVGMIDFAGSGVVHMTGGCTALIAAYILGPRKGRFHDDDGNVLAKPVTFAPHSVSLQVLGTFILWVGWYGFNAGSTIGISWEGAGDIAGLCAVTTTLSAASGCISSLFSTTIVGMLKTGEAEYDLSNAMNGALAGLVGITANCSVVTPWAACLIGVVSGWVYVGSSKLLVKLRIDDAVDAIPVHFFSGIWGCLATGLFAEPTRILKAYGGLTNAAGDGALHAGWFYSWGNDSGDAHLLLCELCGILLIIGWCTVTMFPFFKILQYLDMLRVDPLEEDVGLDISHHKGSAYDLDGPSKADVDELVARRSVGSGGADDDDLKNVDA